MRILHTSDWHIGRTFHGHATLDALRRVLDRLVEQVRENAVDLVILAGDVFDSATPGPACYPVLTDTLVALADAGAQVIVTSGNHDSAARLGFQSSLLRSGIHVVTDPAGIAQPISLADAFGPVHVYALPFLEPTLVRHLWPDATLRTQRDVLEHALALVRADAAARGGRYVVAAHCFAAGVDATPGVEREIRQGSLDVVPLAAFDGPDYVALGHIHGRQVLSERVRYAGAPLHYSFGEADKPRGSWLIELGETGLGAVSWLDLPVPRRLVTLRGPLDDLLTDPAFDAHTDDWVCAQYTDATPQPDPMRRLLARFPHCATVMHTPEGVRAADGASYVQRVRQARSDAELVDAFLTHVRNGEGASAAEAEIIADLVQAQRATALAG